MPLTVVQVLPALEGGGVEQGTIEVARELVRRGHRAIVVAARGRMVPQLEEAGADYLDWDIGRKSVVSLRHVLPLRRLLRSRQVDILHARSRLPAWI
ncbi:MAG: glycosyltransferase, partial [Gammaproteobacteria bacterium]